jgi:ribonucleoside-diphosphate reductase alpha chain
MSVFPSTYEEFIYKRTYSRWLEKESRRENWSESVQRYSDFFINHIEEMSLAPEVKTNIRSQLMSATRAVVKFEVMPSMRALWAAGPALAREHIAGYNCAFTSIDDPRAFSEILYILMNGTGAGFSVERQNVSKLPEIPDGFFDASRVLDSDVFNPIVFADSKLGWAEGYRKFISALYEGIIPAVDTSKIRKKGSRLKTFGGRASGPEPLIDLLKFTTRIFKQASGRKLTSIECHDICCMIANCVVVGGVRRSAGISLSNLSDMRMRGAKDGEFWILQPHRALSNNSVAYTEKPDMIIFMEEWMSLMKSGNGERGIVNREGLQKTAASLGRDPNVSYGVNPCGEIILRPNQFCNLSEIIVRADDTLESLMAKAIHATTLGVLQSTLTDFGFLRKVWKDNCEEERLLGVSLTGTCDHPILQNQDEVAYSWLVQIKAVTRLTSNSLADALGINRPKAITCVNV